MSDPAVNFQSDPSPRRAYDAPRRAASAEATRLRILETAEGLFLERGFTGTTTKAIATGAGVAEKTVFLVFPSKAALLSEIVRRSLRGDEPEVRVARTERWAAMLAAPTDELLDEYAALAARLLGAAARILVIADAAAMGDPELAARRDLGHASNRATIGTVVDELGRRSELVGDATEARDILFALTSEAVYLRLVVDSGWSQEHYVRWLSGAARHALLGG